MRDSRYLAMTFRALSEPRQAALLEYAEYLASKEQAEVAAKPPSEPLPIPRPAEENVVKAIQRLTETYPMLERKLVFHEASSQMTRHLIHGVKAADAIDELERIFARHYELHREKLEQDESSRQPELAAPTEQDDQHLT